MNKNYMHIMSLLLSGMTRNKLGDKFDAALNDAGLGIDHNQLWILIQLWNEDGRKQIELCKSTLKDKFTMSRLIDKMEYKGLVERKEDKLDGRINRIMLTDLGNNLKDECIGITKRIIGDVFEDFSEKELDILGKLLVRVMENVMK